MLESYGWRAVGRVARRYPGLGWLQIRTVSNFTGGRELGFAQLDRALDRLVSPGMLCVDVGAFSGVYSRKFHERGAETIAVEAFAPSVANLKKRIGRHCRVVQGLLADANRHYAIANKAEIRMIGEVPVYESVAFKTEIESRTYDSLFGDQPQPDILKISGCNVCEALIGARRFLIDDKKCGALVFVMDRRNRPANPNNNASKLYRMLRQSGRAVFSIDDLVNGRGPLSAFQFNKKVFYGWQVFVARKAIDVSNDARAFNEF